MSQKHWSSAKWGKIVAISDFPGLSLNGKLDLFDNKSISKKDPKQAVKQKNSLEN